MEDIPYLYFYRRNSDGKLKMKILDKMEDITRYQHVFVMPLNNKGSQMDAVAVGRANRPDLPVQITNEENVYCSMRFVFKYGMEINRSQIFSLKILSDSEDIILDLKWWVRIYLNAVCSFKTSNVLEKFSQFEKFLQAHISKFSNLLPVPTTEYMQSWGNVPMTKNWNLFAKELQLYEQEPTKFYSVPVDLVIRIKECILGNGDKTKLKKDLQLLKQKHQSKLDNSSLSMLYESNPLLFEDKRQDKPDGLKQLKTKAVVKPKLDNNKLEKLRKAIRTVQKNTQLCITRLE